MQDDVKAPNSHTDDSQSTPEKRRNDVSTIMGLAVGELDTAAESRAPLGASLEPGRVFAGKYKIIRQIGGGGVGRVYLARDEDLEKLRAIKVLHEHTNEDSSAIARFKREAKACARVEHPNIVRVVHSDEFEGRGYLVMEYLEGENLADRLRRDGGLPVATAVAHAGVLLDVLATLHAQGIIHRDVKPSNIFLQRTETGETIKVLDFGMAKLSSTQQSRELTRAGAVIGTPAYMSPEQCQGLAVDGRSDIYSLGVVLYHMLAGRAPFDAESPLVLMNLHVNYAAVALHAAAPQVPRAISNVVMKMLSKEPADRYQTPSDCARDLATATGAPFVAPAQPVAETPTERTIDSQLGPPTRVQRRSKVLLYVAATIVGIAVIVWAGKPGNPPPPSPPPVPASLVLIAGGPAAIGRDSTDCPGVPLCKVQPEEMPAHVVNLETYYISKYEVTNKEYAEFVNETGHTAPKGWNKSFPLGAADYPVSNVSWDDAVAYCEWRSRKEGIDYRLPTEAEWEHAAKGNDDRLFPWGDPWSDSLANWNRSTSGSAIAVNQPPNSTTDMSASGVFAMAGNVSEWTASAFEVYPGSAYRPTRPEASAKVFRGGSFRAYPTELRTTCRYWEAPSYSDPSLGFRLAASPRR